MALCFGQQVGEEEELNGKRFVSLSYPKESIPFYQREILKHIQQDIFIPMSFMLKNNRYQVYYELSGLIPLQQVMSQLGTARMPSITLFCVQLSRELIHQLWRAEDHLLLLNDFQLSMDAIFFDEENKRIRIAFLPSDQHALPEGGALNQFFVELENATLDEQWSIYSHYLRDKLQKEYAGLKKLEKLLKRMEEELIYSE